MRSLAETSPTLSRNPIPSQAFRRPRQPRTTLCGRFLVLGTLCCCHHNWRAGPDWRNRLLRSYADPGPGPDFDRVVPGAVLQRGECERPVCAREPPLKPSPWERQMLEADIGLHQAILDPRRTIQPFGEAVLFSQQTMLPIGILKPDSCSAWLIQGCSPRLTAGPDHVEFPIMSRGRQ